MTWITHPLVRGVPLGSAAWFQAQRAMIEQKPLVQRCYRLWYKLLLADADTVPDPDGRGRIVELGSGSGYVKQIRPSVIATDIMPGAVDMLMDGRYLPFANGSVKALMLTHVFHHIPDVGAFLQEAERVLMPGGVISIIDETHTWFARLFFDRIHPEPYDDRVAGWTFPDGGTMLDSNQALTWIVFDRDRERFHRDFPRLRIEQRTFLPWLSYLLSGGVNLRSAVPAALCPLIAQADKILTPADPLFAIHWHIRVRKLGS